MWEIVVRIYDSECKKFWMGVIGIADTQDEAASFCDKICCMECDGARGLPGCNNMFHFEDIYIRTAWNKSTDE